MVYFAELVFYVPSQETCRIITTIETNEIITKVKDILNEHGGDDAISIATDRVLLDEYIKSAIPDAVVMLGTKGYRVNVKNWTTLTDGKLSTDGMIGLLCLKLNTWKMPLSKITKIGEPEYIIAMNKHTAPGVNRPICYRLGNYIIPLPVGTGIEIGEYNAVYDGKEISADDDTATAVCYMTAALVLGMFGDDAGKQRLSDIATNILQ